MKLLWCKTCRKCCRSYDKDHRYQPWFSKREIAEVRKEKGGLKTKRIGNLYRFVQPTSTCLFLREKGCTLKHKPLQCIIFPFRPTRQGWVVQTMCSYWDRMTKKHLEQVKAEFMKRKSDWKSEYRWMREP